MAAPAPSPKKRSSLFSWIRDITIVLVLVLAADLTLAGARLVGFVGNAAISLAAFALPAEIIPEWLQKPPPEPTLIKTSSMQLDFLDQQKPTPIGLLPPPPEDQKERLKQRARLYAQKYRLPENWFLALIEAESNNWNPLQHNQECNGRGLGQITPAAAMDCHYKAKQAITIDPDKFDQHFDPDINLNCAAWHLAQHYEYFGKDAEKATLAYQNGRLNVERDRVGKRGKAHWQEVRRIMRRDME
jgi:soluble lytic murein transglycosylase-like protein